MLIGLILILFGACAAFFGYQMYRFTVFFQGFVAGAVIGGMLGNNILLSLVLGLVLGIVLGIMAVVLLRLGVFLQCFVSAFCVLFIPAMIRKIMGMMNWQTLLRLARDYYLTGALGIDIETEIIVALVAGVTVGIIGLVFTRIVITVLSALAGGAIAGMGLITVLKGIAPQLAVIFGIILAVAGIVYQYLDWKKKGKSGAATTAQAVPVQMVPVQQAPVQQAAAIQMPVQQPEQRTQETSGIRYCGQCGTQMSGTARFCPKCGKQQ